MTCPHCGGELDNVDTLDTEWETQRYYDYCVGNCPKCHKVYWWTEVYTFSHTQDLEEKDDDE